MVQLTRIYTKGGDKGKTSLGSGQRISKASSLVHAIGEVDEANSYIGLVRTVCKDPDVDTILKKIQNDLFDLGADLCMPLNQEIALRISDQQVKWLEQQIDSYNADLPALKSFVLPGGTEVSAHLYIARAVCRRAERATVLASQNEELNLLTVQYLNRLSDLLFVLGRYLNDKGNQDVLWVPGAGQQ